MHDLNWDDLRFFLSVAAKGSISGAARDLRTSHSTVLRRLASLEKKLGARLFKRLPGGYTITQAGEHLRERLTGVAEKIDSAQRQLSGLDTRPSGTIRVTSTDTLMHGLLLPLLAEFRRAYPEILLQVVVNNTFLSLTKREADVAIRPTSRPSENLVGRRVGRIQTALYASRAYWKANARKDSAEHPWVVPDDSLAHLAQAKWAAKHVSAERIAVSVDTLLGMVGAVRAGIGIGMLLMLLADHDDQLVRIGEAEPQFDTDVWILTHADLKHVHRIRLFTDFMHERLRMSDGIATST
ncbi:MAG: LysR family transcriptional regulator [Woeseiaceae bacterium]